jgi:hypothetical protein
MPNSDLFIATDEVARAGAETIPTPEYDREPEPGDERLAFGSFTDIELTSLWLILRGENLSTARCDEENKSFPLVYQGDEEGPWIVQLPVDLHDRLARMDAPYIASAALLWATTIDSKWTRISWEDARDHLTLIVALAKLGKDTGKNLYLRITM